MEIADILIHIHPDLTTELQAKLEESVATCGGVLSVHFSPKHSHELTVAYDPEKINSQAVLAQVKQWDKAAMMTGF